MQHPIQPERYREPHLPRILFLVAVLVAGHANLLLPETSPFHVPTHVVSLLGKYLCYAILASRSIWFGVIAASFRSVMARSSRSAATPWACT